MADYYPLIAKAVAALQPNTPDARHSIYERARGALTRQLASIDPPPPGAVIERELSALEDVIRRVESEIASQTAEIRAEAGPSRTTPRAEAGGEPDAAEPEGPALPVRPAAPVRRKPEPNRKPIYAVGAALALVAVASIAALAFLRRNEPPAMAGQRSPASTPAPAPAADPTRKTDERVASSAPEGPLRPPELRPSPPPVQAPQQPATQPQQPAAAPQPSGLAVANRLVMAMEGTDRPENIVVRQGAVVWRTEMVSGGQGQPPQLAIRALLDAPEARMRAEMTIQRNRDPAFPASHTIQVQFAPGEGSEFGPVRNLSQIELRQTENQPGYPLAGQGIAVVENVFLLALTQIEPVLSRNVEMLRTRPLLYFEFQSSAGRRGLMVFEKGVSGQQAFDDAFRNWQ